jgi:hypothetical protein
VIIRYLHANVIDNNNCLCEALNFACLRFLFQAKKLMQFGYISQSNIETGELRHENELVDGLKRMQVTKILLNGMPIVCSKC